MDRESFIEVLRKQYSEEITEAYHECEHGAGRPIDYPKLNKLLAKLMRNAKVEGLSAKDFEELVVTTLPGIGQKIDLRLTKAAA